MTNSNDALRAALGDKPAVEKIAILSNQDWPLARVDMAATLDMIHEIAVAAIYPASPVAPALSPVIFRTGPCQHRWSHAPTVGYYSCVDCGERHDHGTPMYEQIKASYATPSPVAGGDLREAKDSLHQIGNMDEAEIRNEPRYVKELVEEALAALNQPAAPVEAVAYWYRHPTHMDEPFGTQPLTEGDKAAGWTETPLYTHPPEPAASTVAQGDQ